MQSADPPVQDAPPESVPTRAVRQSRDYHAQWKRKWEHIRPALSKGWTQLRALGTTAQQKYSFLAWLGTAVTVVIGGLGLRYAYEQQVVAYQSMRLAEWTARKDFKEICQEQAQATTPLSHKCEMILRDPLPEPPYIQLDRWKRWQSQHDTILHHHDNHSVTPGYSPMQSIPATNAHLRLYPWTVILTMGFLIFWYRRRLQQLIVGTRKTHAPAEPYDVLCYPNYPNYPIYREHSLHLADRTGQVATSIEAPSKNNLRHRHAKINHEEQATIWKAAKDGSVEEVERHLESGVDVNIHSTSLGTPLSVAAYHGRIKIVKLLISHGADPCGRYSCYKENALQAAAEGGHQDVVGILLDRGADLNAAICGLRAICAAAWRGHSNVVQMLVDRGAQESLIKGLSTNGIVLAADHANMFIIGWIMNLDTNWPPKLPDPKREIVVSNGAVCNGGQPNLISHVDVLAAKAKLCWMSRFDDD